jgi:DNA (cytosine-5)-methyltransferase 1
MKPRLLDLFCGAGGAAMGYHRAGFEVVGVDIKPQPHYPFQFFQADALEFLEEGLGYTTWDQSFNWYADAIHASPPCQAFTKARKLQGNKHEDLVGRTRELLIETGLHYVIENVKGAPLVNPVVLEGQMFPELNVHRPRLFETNWHLEVPLMRPPPPRQTKMGRPLVEGEAIQVVGHFSDVPAGRRAMGINWMTQGELAQAIPPAYTEFIGEQLMAHIKQAVPA